MPEEKPVRGSDLSALLLTAGVGAVGAYLWWRKRPPLPTSTAMQDRVCVVTGGNAGIGKATALELARQGAHVVLACRSPAKGDAACGDIRRQVPDASVQTLPLDLESIDSIRNFVDLFRETQLPLHVLINNAAIMPGKPATIRGMEHAMVVNHLGPFLLTHLLLPDLRKSASSSSESSSSALNATGGDEEGPQISGTRESNKNPASRIINVGSRLEMKGKLLPLVSQTDSKSSPSPPPENAGWFDPPPGEHDAFGVYGTSKLGTLLFTFELDRRLTAQGAESRTSVASAVAQTTPSPASLSTSSGHVTVNAVTPGLVNTALGDGTISPWIAWAAAPVKALLMRSVEKGAETIVWAATSEEVENVGGKFFGDKKETPSSDVSKDEEVAERLWEASEVAVGLDESERIH